RDREGAGPRSLTVAAPFFSTPLPDGRGSVFFDPAPSRSRLCSDSRAGCIDNTDTICCAECSRPSLPGDDLMRVFVAGGTGMIRSRLVRILRSRNDAVVLLTRRPDAVRQNFADCTIVEGDPMQAGAWMDAVADCDAAINLTGENLFGRRWNVEFKKLL